MCVYCSQRYCDVASPMHRRCAMGLKGEGYLCKALVVYCFSLALLLWVILEAAGAWRY